MKLREGKSRAFVQSIIAAVDSQVGQSGSFSCHLADSGGGSGVLAPGWQRDTSWGDYFATLLLIRCADWEPGGLPHVLPIIRQSLWRGRASHVSLWLCVRVCVCSLHSRWSIISHWTGGERKLFWQSRETKAGRAELNLWLCCMCLERYNWLLESHH